MLEELGILEELDVLEEPKVLGKVVFSLGMMGGLCWEKVSDCYMLTREELCLPLRSWREELRFENDRPGLD